MLERSAVEHYLQERAEDMGRREAALREQAIEAREKALKQSIRMLDYPLLEQRVVETDDEGNPVTMIFLPASWSKATIPGLFRMAVGDGSPPEEDSDDLVDVSRWSEAELHQYVQLMRTAMNAERDTERDTDRRQGPGAGT